MWSFNRTVASVFVTSGGGALANIQPALGFRAIGPGVGVNNLVSVLSDALANGRQVHVFINAGNQITSVQMI